MLVTSCSVSTWLLGTWQKLACNRALAVCSQLEVRSAAALWGPLAGLRRGELMHPTFWLECVSCSGSHHNIMMQRGNPTPKLIAWQMRTLVGVLTAMQYAAMLPDVVL